MAFDFHCPYVRETKLYFVGSPNDSLWNEQCKFSKILESIPDKSLYFSASSNIKFGTGWNNSNNYKSGKSFSRWAGELENIILASSVEIPYANSGPTTITPETARSFGSSYLKAMYQYLKQL